MVQRKFDRIHEMNESFSVGAEQTLNRHGTIIPLIMNDDALGDPMSYNTHPEHASFTEEEMPNCYPDSEIRNFKLTFTVQMLKALYVTSVLHNIQFQYALIACAFPEDLDAIDEISGLSLKAILELQKETTDRQCYPLWGGQKLSNASLINANVPGLTAGQTIEEVAWQPEIIKDQMRYGKLKGLLRKSLPFGIRTSMITTAGSYMKRITIRAIPSNTKFINPYTFLGLMFWCKKVASGVLINIDENQTWIDTESETSSQLNVALKCTYNERNPEFHMAKV